MRPGRTRSPLLRALAFLTALSLAMMPCMQDGQLTTVRPGDVGTMPVSEEEAPHQCPAPVPSGIMPDATADAQPLRGPHTDDETRCGAHGEVRHPPPWC